MRAQVANDRDMFSMPPEKSRDSGPNATSIELKPSTTRAVLVRPRLVDDDVQDVQDDGQLHLAFADGAHIEVAPDEGYEAWNVTGPGGARIVSLPGGELAVWSAEGDA